MMHFIASNMLKVAIEASNLCIARHGWLSKQQHFRLAHYMRLLAWPVSFYLQAAALVVADCLFQQLEHALMLLYRQI